MFINQVVVDPGSLGCRIFGGFVLFLNDLFDRNEALALINANRCLENLKNELIIIEIFLIDLTAFTN